MGTLATIAITTKAVSVPLMESHLACPTPPVILYRHRTVAHATHHGRLHFHDHHLTAARPQPRHRLRIIKLNELLHNQT